MEVRIVLGEEAFRALVRGGELTVKDKQSGQTVKMILQDIGFVQMQIALDDASMGKEHYKGVTINGEGEVLQ